MERNGLHLARSSASFRSRSATAAISSSSLSEPIYFVGRTIHMIIAVCWLPSSSGHPVAFGGSWRFAFGGNAR